MSFSKKVLAGLGLGVLTGLFLGDYAAIFKWPADGFIRLLQTTVFPYITVSIINNLGRLEPHQARRLAARVGIVIGTLWLLTLTFAFLIALSFPTQENASFFSTTLLQSPEAFDFLGLYLPSNPFYALANSVVPAIVVFAILMGISLMMIERKDELLKTLSIVEAAIARATRMVMRLTPYGLFAIAANAAGTLNIDQFQQIQIYVIAYAAVGALLGLWIMPGLIAALTTLKVREVLSRAHEGLITATLAGDVFIVLPVLIDASKDLLRRHDPDRHVPDLPEVIVPTAYNLPHSGKLLSLSFILFAAWYADSPLSITQLPRLAATGVLTLFGSINVAVPFLLDAFKVPADTFQLFVAMSVVNSRVGSFIAAVHTLTVAVLGSAAVVGHLRFDARRLIRFAVISTVATAALIGGLRTIFATVLATSYSKDQLLMTMRLISPPVPAVVRDEPDPAASEESGPVMDAVTKRGRIRVGFTTDSLPFTFKNASGQFVGHDVDLAHMLARELGVTLEFVPIARSQFIGQLRRGDFDVAMSGIPITTEFARDALFSNAYLHETLAFVVPDSMRHQYETWDSIRSMGPVSIASVNLPYYVDKLTRMLPNARVVRVSGASELFQYDALGTDAALLTAERGSAWTLLHPELSVVVPQPNPIRIPLAFAVGRRDAAFAAFLNSWIDLKRQDGTLDLLYRHWILGADAVARQPRWSVMRDVLHWVR
jgi:Na+/H+-dicarboxylate symporter